MLGCLQPLILMLPCALAEPTGELTQPAPAALHALEPASWPANPPAIGDWRENLRLIVDESARGILNLHSEVVATVLAIGIDSHLVVSNDDGDIGTLVLQPYVTRIDDLAMRPPFFEGPDDWELVFRICSFNYTALSRGLFNIKVGHVEIPFGLETLIDTNGTVRQYDHGPNLGVKADWGATLNGVGDEFEYEVGWSRGTGNEWTDRGDPGVVFGRVGTPRTEDWVLGLSGFDGDVLTGMGIVDRSRVGVDISHYRGALGYLFELSGGQDFDTDVRRILGELNWRNDYETVQAYLQVRDAASSASGTGSNWNDTLSTALGLTYEPGSEWSFSLQWTQTVASPGAGHEDGMIIGQLRYRF